MPFWRFQANRVRQGRLRFRFPVYYFTPVKTMCHAIRTCGKLGDIFLHMLCMASSSTADIRCVFGVAACLAPSQTHQTACGLEIRLMPLSRSSSGTVNSSGVHAAIVTSRRGLSVFMSSQARLRLVHPGIHRSSLIGRLRRIFHTGRVKGRHESSAH